MMRDSTLRMRWLRPQHMFVPYTHACVAHRRLFDAHSQNHMLPSRSLGLHNPIPFAPLTKLRWGHIGRMAALMPASVLVTSWHAVNGTWPCIHIYIYIYIYWYIYIYIYILIHIWQDLICCSFKEIRTTFPSTPWSKFWQIASVCLYMCGT